MALVSAGKARGGDFDAKAALEAHFLGHEGPLPDYYKDAAFAAKRPEFKVVALRHWLYGAVLCLRPNRYDCVMKGVAGAREVMHSVKEESLTPKDAARFGLYAAAIDILVADYDAAEKRLFQVKVGELDRSELNARSDLFAALQQRRVGQPVQPAPAPPAPRCVPRQGGAALTEDSRRDTIVQKQNFLRHWMVPLWIRGPGEVATFDARFVLGADGCPTSVKIFKDNFPPPNQEGLRRGMESLMSRWDFPKPTTSPFTFDHAFALDPL